MKYGNLLSNICWHFVAMNIELQKNRKRSWDYRSMTWAKAHMLRCLIQEEAKQKKNRPMLKRLCRRAMEAYRENGGLR